MSNVKVQNDIISEWYVRGFHQIVDKIFLNLPLRSLLACRQVNRDWERIVNYYNGSPASSVAKVWDLKIRNEWRKFEPTVSTTDVGFNVSNVYGLSIAYDDRNIIMVRSDRYHPPKGSIPAKRMILIFEAETLEQIKSIDIEERIIEKLKDSLRIISLGLTEDYLVSSVIQSNSETTIYSVLLWRRNENFDFVAVDIKGDYDFLRCNWYFPNFRPNVSNKMLYIPVKCNPEVVYDQWDISSGACEQLTHRYVRNEEKQQEEMFISNLYFPFFDSFLHLQRQAILVMDMKICKVGFYPLGSQTPIWEITKNGHFPEVMDVSDDQVAILWRSNVGGNVVEILNLESGKVIFSIDKRSSNINQILSVKMSGGRVAVCGRFGLNVRDDIVVFDVETAQMIFSVFEYLKPSQNLSSQFILEKNRLIYFYGTNLVSAKFWF